MTEREMARSTNGATTRTDDSIETPKVEAMLTGFGCHGLADLGQARLMSRFDRKFVAPIERLPDILSRLCGAYSALEIEGRRVFHYESLYFDTPSMDFFRMHHDGHLNRYKVRHRVYVDTDTRFLEVKFKNNQRKTEKSRIQTGDEPGELHDDGLAFLEDSLNGDYEDLSPTQLCRFRRIALANEASAERVTLDFDLSFQVPGRDDVRRLPRLLVAELKQARRTADSPFYRSMRRMNLRPSPFSKYCIGSCLSREGELKANRFKRAVERVRAIGEVS